MYPSTLKKNLPHYLSLRFSGGVPTIKAPLIAPTDVPQSQCTSIFASWVPSFEGMFVEQAKPVRGPSSRPSWRGAIGEFRRNAFLRVGTRWLGAFVHPAVRPHRPRSRVHQGISPRTRAELRRYKVEPYVVAADVYAAPDHAGHGGWTWYTGSAGWMHRAGLESILGMRFEGSFLHFDPCIPNSWPRFEIRLRRRSAKLDMRTQKVSARSVAANPDGWNIADAATVTPRTG
jgi:Glycosyl hydrolase 36 superfamily, catalytic domain